MILQIGGDYIQTDLIEALWESGLVLNIRMISGYLLSTLFENEEELTAALNRIVGVVNEA